MKNIAIIEQKIKLDPHYVYIEVNIYIEMSTGEEDRKSVTTYCVRWVEF